MKTNSQQAGFSVVELVVVILVASIFLLSAIQLNGSVASVASDSSQQTIASNLAYNNMRSYANGRSPLWYDCVTYGNGPQTLLNTTGSYTGLPGTVTQSVVATAPYGCTATGERGTPIRIQSKVTYGPQSKVVTHATYAAY